VKDEPSAGRHSTSETNYNVSCEVRSLIDVEDDQ
jgi:hypothetical protein